MGIRTSPLSMPFGGGSGSVGDATSRLIDTPSSPLEPMLLTLSRSLVRLSPRIRARFSRRKKLSNLAMPSSKTSKLTGPVFAGTVAMSDGFTGLRQYVGDTSYFTSRNNRFSRNTYLLDSGSEYFHWQNGRRTVEEWRAYGHDIIGTFSTSSMTPFATDNLLGFVRDR